MKINIVFLAPVFNIVLIIIVVAHNAYSKTDLEKTTKELYGNQAQALKCLEDIGNLFWEKEGSCPVPICGKVTIEGEKLFRDWNEEFSKMGYELRLVKLKSPSDEMLKKIDEAYQCIIGNLGKNNPNVRFLLEDNK